MITNPVLASRVNCQGSSTKMGLVLLVLCFPVVMLSFSRSVKQISEQ